MPRLLVALLMLPFLIGCSEKPKPEILVLPESTTDEQLAEKLKGLSNLKELDLSYNTRITDEGLVHLKGLTNLETLYLFNTKVTDAGLSHLKGLTKLETLNLGYTKITDAGLVHLKGLSNLETLDLNGTKITDAGLAHLKGLSNLKKLNLWGTKTNPAGIKSLQEALPGCDISR